MRKGIELDMKQKWCKGQYGVAVLAPASEFLPRKYKTRIYDLRKLGVPTVPVIGQTSYNRIGEHAGWHVHEGCIEFIYCAAGACEYESGGRRHSLDPGMMFVSRADEEHRQLNCPKGYANFYFLFRPAANRTSHWFGAALAKLPRLISCKRSVPARFARIFALAEGGRTGQELEIRLQTEVQALLLDILDSTARPVAKSSSETIGAIAVRMRQNPERDYPLDELVAESGMSKASFMSLFKAVHGYPPHAYLLSCRVEAAKPLLKRGMPEKEVAVRLGFVAAQNLARAFLNYVGVRPREWVAKA